MKVKEESFLSFYVLTPDEKYNKINFKMSNVLLKTSKFKKQHKNWLIATQ